MQIGRLGMTFLINRYTTDHNSTDAIVNTVAFLEVKHGHF